MRNKVKKNMPLVNRYKLMFIPQFFVLKQFKD
jgi:hypothetical protein